MTPTLEDAIVLAARAHAGQTDKAGAAYILHPLRVMLAQKTDEARIVAVLHDVVEDCGVTLDDLRARGYPEVVVAAIEALSKRPGEGRVIAARRTVQNPLARVVKLADLADNMELSRLPVVTDEARARMEEYRAVLAILEE